jgi:hypothetical protein
MAYKDPERKRQWEREHREQRNARRRAQPPRDRPLAKTSTTARTDSSAKKYVIHQSTEQACDANPHHSR